MVTTRQIEDWAPMMVASACTVAWYLRGEPIPGAYSKELLSALLSVAAICAGFLTTALSILLTIGSTETGRKLQSNQLLVPILLYLNRAIFGCLAWACASLLTFFFLPGDTVVVGLLPSTLLVFFTVYASSTLTRIAIILLNVFERMSEPEDKQG